jgi:signal transduction histidine kinase
VRFFFSPSPSFVRLLHAPPTDAFARPLTPLIDVRERAADLPPTQRIRVEGVVTHWWPGHAAFISSGGHALALRGEIAGPLAAGAGVEAVGFREQGKAAAFLEDSVVRPTRVESMPPQAVEITAAAAASGSHEAALVTLHAHYVERASEAGDDILLLQADGAPFTARMRGTMTALRPGDEVRLTGICTSEDLPSTFARHGWTPGPFQLLLRSPADLMPLSWWTRERLGAVAAVAVAVLMGAALWITTLRRRVTAQTAVIQEKVREAAALDERNRIARELHDTLAQGFAGTAFALEGIATNLAPDDRVRPQIDMALRMVRHSLTEARRSVMNLRAEALEDRDLASALAETASRLVAGHAVDLRTDITPPATPRPPSVENEIFRIAVEAIANALRHAQPRSLQLTLHERTGDLLLSVRDDGAGFDAATPPASGHFGLLGMKERARRIGAELLVESSPGHGTEVKLILPRGKSTS